MTTDNTQELDEVLYSFAKYIRHHDRTGLGGGGINQHEAKQALLDWHNKQIEGVLDRLSAEVKRAYDKEGDFLEMAVDTIEAERNKLKEG